MIEFLFEVVFELLFEFIAEGALQWGYRGAARAARSPLARWAVGAAAGAAFGVWWGDHLSAPGRHHGPRLFWVSVALAAVAAALALRRHTTARGDIPPSPPIAPWRWPVHRLVGFAIMNAAVAIGIVIGYEGGT